MFEPSRIFRAREDLESPRENEATICRGADLVIRQMQAEADRKN